MIITRKFKITIVGSEEERKEKYRWIRDEMYNQYKGLNALMALTTSRALLEQFEGSEEYRIKIEIENIKKKIQKKEEKERNKEKINTLKENLKEINNKYKEIKQNKSNFAKEFENMFLKNDYQTLTQLPFQYSYTKSLIHSKVKSDFKNMIKNGFLSGKIKATNYKNSFPLMIQAKDLKFEFDDDVSQTFISYLPMIARIKFKIIMPTKKRYKNYLELQHVLNNLKNGSYIPKQSNVQFDSDNKLILNLTMDIPEKKKSEKIPGRIVGIDLGIKIPAYCALNDNPDIKRWLGNFNDFIRISQRTKNKRRSLQISLKYTKGGHGRIKKLQALDRFKERQSNFHKTYNEYISSEIIKFAVKNKAEQINLELLSLQKKKGRSILNDWSYYQLGQMIKRKAESIGIIVKFIDPYHTSQICSICGHYEKGQREKQAEFICKKCNIKLNADYNAARNIAMSTKYIENKEESEWYKQYKNKEESE
jgi:IS605 OrfB family transposase